MIFDFLSKNSEKKKHRKLLSLAKHGDANAQYDLGEAYYHGKGVDKDLFEAVKWYKLAADQGDEKAKRLYQKWL